MIYVRWHGDTPEFNDGKKLQLSDGTWVSNPTQEMMFAEGFEIYVPPVVPPTPETEPQYDDMLKAVKRMLDSQVEQLSDEDAIEVAALFPTWISKMDEEVHTGERYWYDGKLWKVIQQHTVQENWTPDTAVSLYVEVTIEEWPEWQQPQGVQDAYMTGDKVTFEGTHYVSLIDNNTWSPAAYPQGWEERP